MGDQINAVDVIIVNWNGEEYLQECLDGLRSQVFTSFKVIVVDNGSLDNSIEMIQRDYPEVHLIAAEKNLGFSTANNLAFNASGSKYVALLNNDTVPHPLWLKTMVDAMESYPEAGFAASKIIFQYDQAIIDRAGDAYTTSGVGYLRGRGEAASAYNHLEWVFGACAAAAIYRRDMLTDIGFFNEDFFLIYEDVDLSFRAQLNGYKCVFIPEAIVYHKASKSIGQDSDISIYFGHRNLEWVYFQNMPNYLILRTITFHIVYNIAALFFFTLKGKLNIFIKAKWDAIRGFKKVLKQRKFIQQNRKVDDRYIWSLMVKGLIIHRLSQRLQRKNPLDWLVRWKKIIFE